MHKILKRYITLVKTSLSRNRKYNFVQSSIQETCGFDSTISEMGQIFCPCARKFFLFLPKIMLFENNTALGYGIAWDNALTNIFYNLRYSFMPMEHYHI